ncbi:MAG: DNA translocase FtsK 4TM domain-containing protein, partial [Rhodospirillales bacterium]
MAQTMRFFDRGGGRGGRVFSNVARTGGVLPAGAAGFFKRRLAEAVGVGLFCAAALLLTALVSYTPGDPSFNSSGHGAVGNLLGPPGAIVADLALQTFGFAGGLPALVLVVWGWRMMTKRGISLWGLRVVVLLGAMTLLAAALDVLAAPDAWPLMSRLGGVVGTLVLGRLHGAGQAFGLDPAPVAAALALIGILVLMPALAMSLREWHASGRALGWGLAALGRGAKRGSEAFGVMPAWRHRLDVGDDEPGDDDIGDIDPVTVGDPTIGPSPARPTRTGLVAAKKPRPKVGRRVQTERQGKLDLSTGNEYQTPPLDLLDKRPDGGRGDALNRESLQQNAKFLGGVLDDFGVRGEIVKVRPGPVITLYELEPAPGTKTSRVIGLSDDIARSMSAVSVRIAVVPGQSVIGIELPNVTREMVTLGELLVSETFEKASGKLPLALGKDISGAPVIVDLARMPHLLIAGTTGSGKSVAMNTMILSLVYRLPPEQCKFIMIDPKMLELSVYEGIPHLLTPVVTEPAKAIVALKWTVREMEERYRAMSQLGVRNINGYNARLAEAKKKGETLTRHVQTGFDDAGQPVMEDQPLDMEPLPHIVVVVDEMADLMLVAGKDVEAAIQRLAQMARAAGIHLIMATQRPSVDVITGTIKANFPTRISFQVTSKIDSRTILGEQGAEQLLGQGDMLYMA